MSKAICVTTEYELVEAVSLHIAGLQLSDVDLSFDNERSSERNGADLWLNVRMDGRQQRFAVDCRLHPEARDIVRFPRQTEKIAPLLAAPSISESLVELCRERGVSCLDLNGRLYLRHRGILIDRQPVTRSYRTAKREPALFAAKSSRLARCFLSYPERRWRQDDLAHKTGCSPALVSRLMGEYARLGWTELSDGRWQLVRADALLDAWTGVDAWSKRGAIRQYSTLEHRAPDLAAQVMSLPNEISRSLAFTQWYAAAQRHPYTELPVVSAYCASLPRIPEAKALGWREVSNGGRLWLIVPDDEGVFQCGRTVEGVPLVSDTQIYLDLLQVGLRGPDAARALRGWEGFRQL